jgi:hypothetical protein
LPIRAEASVNEGVGVIEIEGVTDTKKDLDEINDFFPMNVNVLM